MTRAAEKILSDALALTPKERAELAAKLIDTLESQDDADYTTAWEAEINQRIRQLDSGEVKTVPWMDARSIIRKGGTANEAG